jgi:hypothetical protein
MSTLDTQGVKRYTTGALPLKDSATRADRVERIMANHQRGGGQNMTVREICEAFNQAGFMRAEARELLVLFPHHGEAALGLLEAAKRVVCDRTNKRKCTVTGVLVKVYWLRERQAEMVA